MVVAAKTRSSVFALVRETTEGTLKFPGSSADFTSLRAGAAMQANVETIESDELFNDIGMSEPFVTKETPSGSVPKYMKGSGVEGTAPDWSLFLESLLGDIITHADEPNVVASSTAGDADAAAILQLGVGQGADCEVGMAVLIKDGTNGYNIRNIEALSGDDATLNYNLDNAPASGVLLGKAVHYLPVAEGHPTFSAHMWQAQSNSVVRESIAGCRTTGAEIDLSALGFAMINFSFAGIKAYRNAMLVAATNKYINFNIGGSELTATLTEGSYQTPLALAREVATKMTAAAGTAIVCKFSAITGKFTISKAAGTLQLLWNTGTNTANTAGTLLGYTVSADDTGSLTYAADAALDYDPAYTPAYDDNSPHVVRANELKLGAFDRYQCRSNSAFSVSIETTTADVDDACAETGVLEKVPTSRSVSLTATMLVKAHEVEEFDYLINNTTTQAMFNTGPKVGGNWVAGKCWNLWFPNLKLTAQPMSEKDGYYVYEVAAAGFVDATHKDVHINQV